MRRRAEQIFPRCRLSATSCSLTRTLTVPKVLRCVRCCPCHTKLTTARDQTEGPGTVTILGDVVFCTRRRFVRALDQFSMTTNQVPAANQPNWIRVVGGGLAAGLIVNAFEYGVHRIYLDDAWSAAFRALGKTPTGWSAFIPGNFLIAFCWSGCTRVCGAVTAAARRQPCARPWWSGWSSGRSRC
jgi:hypothetical protein